MILSYFTVCLHWACRRAPRRARR